MADRLPPELQARLTANIHGLMVRKRWRAEHIHMNADVDKGNLSRFFNGHRDYNLRSLVRIAEALDVDVSELFRPQRQRGAKNPKPK